MVDVDALVRAVGPGAHVGHYVLPPRGSIASAAEFEQHLRREGVFFSSSRREFIDRFGRQVLHLDIPHDGSDRLRGHGHCGVLVAQRGSGKSFLFRKLAAAGAALSQRTWFCYVNYKVTDSTTLDTPVRVFAKLAAAAVPALSEHMTHLVTVEHLHAMLEYLGFRVVLLVDEIEWVFGLPPDRGMPILQQLVAIGELDGPRTLLAYITGTSSKVRSLCFVKLSMEEAAKRAFTSYHAHLDFNGRKYSAITLEPISTRCEMDEAYKAMCASSSGRACARAASSTHTDAAIVSDTDGDDDVDLRRLFLESRGVPQALDDLFRDPCRPDAILLGFMQIKRSDRILQQIWRALLYATEDVMRPEAFSAKLSQLADDVFSATPPVVDCAALQRRAGPDGLSTAVLWDYADAGFLTVTAEPGAPGGITVGFAHVSDFLWAVRNLMQSLGTSEVGFDAELAFRELSKDEQDCLLHPSGKTLHERLFAEALAFQYEHITLHDVRHRFTYRWRRCALAEGQRTCDVAAWDATSTWTGEIFTCVPDTFGADLVAFINEGERGGVVQLLVIMWQCKTGNERSDIGPNSGHHKATAIVERFKGADMDAVQNLMLQRSHRLVNIRVERLVATTCHVVPTGDARKILADADIKLLDRAAMSKMWTSRIRRYLDAQPLLRFMSSAGPTP